MFTFIHLRARPYWDLVEWQVLIRWQDDDESAPVLLTKEGTLQVPGDSSPEEILLCLAGHLQAAALSTEALPSTKEG